MLEIVRGDSYSFKAVILSKVSADDQGLPYDLTGYQAKFTMKRSTSDSSPALQVDIDTIDSPEDGIIVIEVPASKTALLKEGNYYYDVQINKDNIVKTPIIGTVKVIIDITT